MTSPHQRPCIQNLLTSTFETQPRHENPGEGKTFAMTCIKKQAVESTDVYKPVSGAGNYTGKMGGNPQKAPNPFTK